MRLRVLLGLMLSVALMFILGKVIAMNREQQGP